MRFLKKLSIWWQQLPDSSIPPYPLTADEWDELQVPARKSTRRRWHVRLGARYKFSVLRYRAVGLS